ncbi:MAG: hypothetical protein HUU37_07235 [Bdellovibrionales bacterium]|nr:hypothetical protein [Bdellovibrionales bacterium]
MIPQGCVAACPACEHRELSPEESLRKKSEALRSLIPDVDPGVWKPIRGARESLGYRRRITLHAEWRQNAWQFGVLRRRPGRKKPEFVAIPDCPVHDPGWNEVFRRLQPVLPKEMPLSFVAASGGFLSLVLKCGAEDAKRWGLGPALEKALEGSVAQAAFLNAHAAAGDRVLNSKGWIPLYGPSLLHDGELGLWYGPDSFQQLVPELYRESVEEAAAFLRGGETVVDLCSGLGYTLRRWTQAGADTVGVELGGGAVAACQKNAPQALVLRGRCSERVPQLDAWLSGRACVVYANPPRLGMEDEVLEWIRERAVRLAYLSCSPGTLRRDILALRGWRVVSLTPFDFFPLTRHAEMLACLERVS